MYNFKTGQSEMDVAKPHSLPRLIQDLEKNNNAYIHHIRKIKKSYFHFKIYLALVFAMLFYNFIYLTDRFGFLLVFSAIATLCLLLLIVYRSVLKIHEKIISNQYLSAKIILFEKTEKNISININKNKEYVHKIVGDFINKKEAGQEVIDREIFDFLKRTKDKYTNTNNS